MHPPRCRWFGRASQPARVPAGSLARGALRPRGRRNSPSLAILQRRTPICSAEDVVQMTRVGKSGLISNGRERQSRSSQQPLHVPEPNPHAELVEAHAERAPEDAVELGQTQPAGRRRLGHSQAARRIGVGKIHRRHHPREIPRSHRVRMNRELRPGVSTDLPQQTEDAEPYGHKPSRSPLGSFATACAGGRQPRGRRARKGPDRFAADLPGYGQRALAHLRGRDPGTFLRRQGEKPEP